MMALIKLPNAFCFCIVLLTHSTLAQIQQNMRSTLVAIQVENLENSIRWYEGMLAFKQIDKKEFKDYGMSIAILELDDFKLELVDNNKALNKNALLKQNGADIITGFAKITFTIDDVVSLYQELKDKGANFAIPLRDSNVDPKEQFFIVTDCDSNWIQFIGPK